MTKIYIMLPISKTVVFLYIWITIKPSTVTTNLTKFILVWTNDKVYMHNNNRINTRRGDGHNMIFTESNCPIRNCYITDDKKFFGEGNEDRFDAILFNGRNIDIFKDANDLPNRRSDSNVKYIFVFPESVCHNTNKDCTDTTPVCNYIFDNFFHLTATFKPGSDIVFSMYENSLRQKMFMACKDHIGRELLPDLTQKKKAVVWFVSNCTDKEKQFEYVANLEKSLSVYSQTLDIYGCGDKSSSPKDNGTLNDLLRDEYFFYLDLEPFDNVLNECPLARNSVPIVYGLENYSRFMPLGTYINAEKYTPEHLATLIAYYVNSPGNYTDFYTNRDYEALYIPPNARAYHCQLCAAINNKQMMAKEKVYDLFRHWWNPNYQKLCSNIKIMPEE